MKYKGLYISQSEDKGVLREVDGVEKECEGLYFMVYADKDYGYEIGGFVGAFGIDMENSEEGIQEFVKSEIDTYLEEYKKQQLYEKNVALMRKISLLSKALLSSSLG